MNPQTWNAAGYEKNARFVTDLGAPVLQLLAPIPNERILDVGCGDGVLTQKIIEAGSHVVGLDSSPDLCAAARRLGLEVVEMSASDMAFETEFDAVFSNAALHWMKDADRVVRNIARALRPKGRFVAEMGGYKCVEIIRSALVEELNCRGYDGESASPWYFPSPAEYRTHLSAAGFEVPYIELIPRPTPIPDMMGWLTTFSHCFTALLPSHERGDYLESVQVRIRPLLCDESGKWTADYTRLRFRAVLEGPAAPQPSSPAVRSSGQHEPALDRNEPGGNGAKEGALIDRDYIRVWDSLGVNRLLVDNGAGAPVPITDGNLQIHISSCSDQKVSRQ